MFLAAANGGVRDAVNGIADSHDQIMLAMIAVVAAAVAALVFVIRNSVNIKIAAEQATQANKAVNNVGPGEHRLYDKIATMAETVAELKKGQEEFADHGWENLPDDLGDSVALTMTIRDLQHDNVNHADKLDQVLAELRQHVAWEMSEKWKYGIYNDKEHP